MASERRTWACAAVRKMEERKAYRTIERSGLMGWAPACVRVRRAGRKLGMRRNDVAATVVEWSGSGVGSEKGVCSSGDVSGGAPKTAGGAPALPIHSWAPSGELQTVRARFFRLRPIWCFLG